MKKNIWLIIAFICLCCLFGCADEPSEETPPNDDPDNLECVHELVEHDAKLPTCLDKGYKAYVECQKCDYTTYEEIEALGHDYEEKVVKEAKCLEKGLKRFVCKNDESHFYEEEINELGHVLVTVNEKESNCIEKGHSEFVKCENCDYHTDYQEYDLKEHLFELDSAVSSTNKTTGYRVYKCDGCENEKYEYVNPLGLSDEDLQELNILFIGNSYTNYNTLVTCFKHLAEAQGIKVNVVKVAYGSQYLHDYVEGEEGDYFYKLEEAVKMYKFDLAFVQGQSAEPVKTPGDFYESARKIHEYLGNYGTKIIMYQTWGYPSGYTSSLKEIDCADTYEMTQKLAAAYEAIASELNVELSPAGTVLWKIHDKYSQNDPELIYVSKSNAHPSPLATYAIALCHFAKVYGTSPMNVSYKFNDYIKDKSITWHCDKKDEITEAMQKAIEQAVYTSVYGASIVEEKYKTSSEGIK